MPPKKTPSKKAPPVDPEKRALRTENAKLRRQLATAEQHRDLLIQTFHGLSKQPGGALRLAPAVAGAKVALSARPQTITQVEAILANYGKVANPTDSTIVGPAVQSMGQFTMDVNNTFSREYVVGLLLPSWNVDQTAYYIDNNP